MAHIIRPPKAIASAKGIFSVFLSSSVEINSVIPWQNLLVKELINEDIAFFNPFRNAWDLAWEEVENYEEKYKEQIRWELEALEQASMIVMYFAADVKAPVSMLEFGLQARTGKLLVCCAKDFWRRKFIDVVCQQYGIPQAESLEDVVTKIKKALQKAKKQP